MRTSFASTLAHLTAYALLLGAPNVFSASAEQIIEQARINASTNRVIVKLRAAPSGLAQPMSGDRINALMTRAGQPLRVLRPMPNGAHVLQLDGSLPNDDAARLAQRLAEDSEVEYAEPDLRMQALATTTNDPFFPEQTYLGAGGVGINATNAWDTTVGGPVVIAVIDTGIVNHADIDLARILPGYDFISADTASGTTFVVAGDGNGRDADPSDPGDRVKAADQTALSGVFSGTCPLEDSSWHGTLVASVIGATTNNALDIAGVNWNARILPMRTLGRCGGFTSDIAEAMRWAAGLHVTVASGEPPIPDNPAANRAQILNLSLGVPNSSCSNTMQATINEILAAGVVKAIVTAAGNEGAQASTNTPGNCAGVIDVAGVLVNGDKADASNYGPLITVAAPYGGINLPNIIYALSNDGSDGPEPSPTGDSVFKVGGTSFAAPLISGTVSLMLTVNPSLTASQIFDILRNTARAFPSGSNCRSLGCGAGTVDAAAAVAMAQNNPPAARTFPGPIPPISGGGSGGGGGGCALTERSSDFGLLLLLGLVYAYRLRRRSTIQ